MISRISRAYNSEKSKVPFRDLPRLYGILVHHCVHLKSRSSSLQVYTPVLLHAVWLSKAMTYLLANTQWLYYHSLQHSSNQLDYFRVGLYILDSFSKKLSLPATIANIDAYRLQYFSSRYYFQLSVLSPYT